MNKLSLNLASILVDDGFPEANEIIILIDDFGLMHKFLRTERRAMNSVLETGPIKECESACVTYTRLFQDGRANGHGGIPHVQLESPGS